MKVVDYILAAFVLQVIVGGLIVVACSTAKKGVMFWKCSDMILYEQHLEVIVPEVCLRMYGEDRE